MTQMNYDLKYFSTPALMPELRIPNYTLVSAQ